MKNVIIKKILTAFCILCSIKSLGQSFEGTITYKAIVGEPRSDKIKNSELDANKDGVQTITYYYKKGKILGISHNNRVISYYDYDNTEVLINCDSEKCKLFSLKKDVSEKNFKIVKTNEIKTIATYKARKYIVTTIHPELKVEQKQFIWAAEYFNEVKLFPIFDLFVCNVFNLYWNYPSISGFPVLIDVPICLEDNPMVKIFGENPCNLFPVAWELVKIEKKAIQDIFFNKHKEAILKEK